MFNVLNVFVDAYGILVVYNVLAIAMFIVIFTFARKFKWSSGPIVLYSYSYIMVGAILSFMEASNTRHLGTAIGGVLWSYALCCVYPVGVLVIGIYYLVRKRTGSSATAPLLSETMQYNTEQTLRTKSKSTFGLWATIIGVIMLVSAPFVAPYILFLPQMIEAHSEKNTVADKNTPMLDNKVSLANLEKLAEEKTYKLSFRPHLPSYFANENDLTLVAHENDTRETVTEMAILGKKVELHQFDAQKFYQKTDVMQICNEYFTHKKPCEEVSSNDNLRVLKPAQASYSLQQRYAYEVDGIIFLLSIDDTKSNIDSEAIRIIKSLKPLVNWQQH